MPIHLPPFSRRQFLARSLLVGASSLLGRRLAAAAGDVDPHAWALLSDSHIAGDRARIARGINMADQFSAAVADVLAQARRPIGGFVNGDLSLNTGEPADYATFAELVSPLRSAGMPLHLALGNHDHREQFWAALGKDASVRRPVMDRQVAMIATERANWFMLDSLDKTNVTPGLLGEAQLAWLAATLDAHAEKPALVMVHHNPVASSAARALLDQDAFYAIIRPRRQVKAYLFGHSHRWSVERDESGVHLINLPSTAYVFESGLLSGWVLAQLEPRSLRLQLRCIDKTRTEHGRTMELTYRS